MQFNKAYNRHEFVGFLRGSFLPDDFLPGESPVNLRSQTKYTLSVTKLGCCKSLDLVVYEIRHRSKNDARVGLSKEAFRVLADEWQDRALVVFVPEEASSNYRFSLITVDLDLSESGKLNRKYSNPRRFSYFLGEGIATHTPDQFLLAKGRVIDTSDLKERFSVEVLTKAFYKELAIWYAWAITEVKFPNVLNDPSDDTKYNAEAMIRLVTRLIFVWFLKQKHLIPNEFFDVEYISDNLLENFNPYVKEDLFWKSRESRYYKAILQNLFFAMLNCPLTEEGKSELTERRFKEGRSGFDDEKRMRYKDMFKNPQLFVSLANKTVPFLNGGLFECLDRRSEGLYLDGFSDRTKVKQSLVVPDFLFFGEEAGRGLNLSGWFGDDTMDSENAVGIIDILKKYNFTVEENTPYDQDVSLDPELLGKVFENLLASYNPETKSTARKQTGSFYTPREIVQYMVDESLIAYLKRAVGPGLEGEYRKLLDYTDDPLNLSDEQKGRILNAIYECKVLDPACGSGAFPMGMLQQMVHVLSELDPTNERWRNLLLDKAIEEIEQVGEGTEEQRQRIADIERSFDENLNYGDYARKLYLIENCIYGVDIQPIAIQISKLRFFISLVIDQKADQLPEDNFGIRPLPNLEAKFVAANTLISLQKSAGVFDSEDIILKQKELEDAKHRIFRAKTHKTKEKYRERVKELRFSISELLEQIGVVGNEESRQLAEWDMFDQNMSAPFFDSEWMFGVAGGFDILIANPPYVLLQNTEMTSGEIARLSALYYSAQYKVDLYHLFFEKGFSLLNRSGILCYITPVSFLKNKYNNKLREIICTHSDILRILRFFVPVFENVAVDNAITLCRSGKTSDNSIQVIDIKEKEQIQQIRFIQDSVCFDQKEITAPQFDFDIDASNNSLVERLKAVTPLRAYAHAYFGIQTFDRKSFVSTSRRDETFFPVIDGANVLRYHILPPSEFVCTRKEAIKSGGNDIIYKQERIVVRQIGAYPEGAICPSGLYTMNTIYNIYRVSEQLDIRYLLALINSKLIKYYWIKSFSDSKKTFPKIKKAPLESIPIINAPEDTKNKIVELVCKIESGVSKNEDVIIFERNIDLMIYHLYCLSYDEVLTVDPSFQLTRAQYENESFNE